MAEVALCTVERECDHYSEERINKLKIPLHKISSALTSVDMTNLLLDIGAGAIIITDVSKSFFLSGLTVEDVIKGHLMYTAVLFFTSFAYITLLSVYIRSVSRPLGRGYAIEIIAYLQFFINVVQVIFTAVTFIVNTVSFSIIKGLNTDTKENDITEEEFMKMLDSTSENSTIDDDEKEMISNVFEFDQKTAGEISTHRKDIVAVEKNASLDEILKIILEEKYSRIPVYDGNVDNITGIFHIKSIIKYLASKEKEEFDINKILMKPYYIPENKKIDELFEEMQENKLQMCVVVDEYGGTQGIVTTEDLIEEVMGSIVDEYDEEEQPDIYENTDGTFVIKGTASLDDIEDELKIELPVDEYDTMGGFLVGILGYIPKDGETPEADYGGYTFCCINAENNCITSVGAIKKTIEPKESETEISEKDVDS